MPVAPVQTTIGVNWEVESNVRSWYRVEGACITPGCGTGAGGGSGCLDPGDSSCGGDVATIQEQPASSGMKYIQVIPAKSLQDLCRLLSSPQPPFYTPVLCWQIQSVKKYNQTVYLSDMPDGILSSCAQLTEEPFQGVPDCAATLLVTPPYPQIAGGYTQETSFAMSTIPSHMFIREQASVMNVRAIIAVPDIRLALSDLDDDQLSGMTLCELKDLFTECDVEGLITSTCGGYTMLLYEAGSYLTVDTHTTGLSINVPVLESENYCFTTVWPLELLLTNNLYETIPLRQFAELNSLDLSPPAMLLYSDALQMWQSTQHFSGLSALSNTKEKWIIGAQFQATNEMDGNVLGEVVWRLSVTVTRINAALGQNKHSKVIVAIPQGTECSNGAFNLSFNINTSTGFATLGANHTTADYSIVYDEIGLFNGNWSSDPVLVLDVASNKVQQGTTSSVVLNSVFGEPAISNGAMTP